MCYVLHSVNISTVFCLLKCNKFKIIIQFKIVIHVIHVAHDYPEGVEGEGAFIRIPLEDTGQTSVNSQHLQVAPSSTLVVVIKV